MPAEELDKCLFYGVTVCIYNIHGNCQDVKNCPSCSDSTCNKAVMEVWNRRAEHYLTKENASECYQQ